MALVWQKRSRGKLYQVRRAGASMRLYTNDVFHSQYNHRHPIADNLWNMLALPAYFHGAPLALKRILVLGVGGGAVMRHLLHMAPGAEVTGIDLDATHLSVARRFFDVKGERVRLIHEEAVQWLSHHEGQKFDLIIDDLFGETVDAQQLPQRAVPVTADWLQVLQRQLAPGGVLGFNLESGSQCAKLKQCVRRAGPSPFVQLTKVTHPRYDNAVAVLLPKTLSKSQLEEALAAEPAYQRWLRKGAFPYRIHSQKC